MANKYQLINEMASETLKEITQNGESWIRWEDKYSIDINVNLSKGLSYGFCREGFDYYKKTCNNNDKPLKCAYIENEKEILRFNDFSCNKDNTIVWIR